MKNCTDVRAIRFKDMNQLWSGVRKSARQLKMMLYKTAIQRRSNWQSTVAEILLPVLFMLILVLLKGISEQYDSPPLDYSCGQTLYQYAEDVTDLSGPDSPAKCIQRPPTCQADHYYREGFTYQGTEFYAQLGYVDPAAVSFPLYAFTVADESAVYDFDVSPIVGADEPIQVDNPSLPFRKMLERMHAVNADLGIAPSNPNSEDVVQGTKDFYDYVCAMAKESSTEAENLEESIRLFDSERDLEKFVKGKNYEDETTRQGKVALAIVFNEANSQEHQWDYKIRTNFTDPTAGEQSLPTVACLYDGGSPWGTGDCSFKYNTANPRDVLDEQVPPRSDYMWGYAVTGFLTLQHLVDEYILRLASGNDTYRLQPSISLYPVEDYNTDNFQEVISGLLGLFYMLSFLYPVSRLIRDLVLEKEMKLKEGMRMMGLRSEVFYISWFTVFVVQLILVDALLVAVTTTSVFEYSDTSLIFLWFFSFSLSIIGFCFLMSTFFSRSKTAATLGTIVFFAAYFPYYAVSDPSYSFSLKTAVCLSAPACFSIGSTVVAAQEGSLIGVQVSNIDQVQGNFTFLQCVIMLLVDAVIYAVLAWYLDNVLPSEYGTKLPWYFPAMYSYWAGADAAKSGLDGLAEPLLQDDVDFDDAKVERVPDGLLRQNQEQRSVCIRGLRKVFKTTAEDKIAVDSLNLDLYEGQINVLLGHNGAGKSTTISMLTGLIPVTSGNAFVRGASITGNMAGVRESLGVCPQHDVLFPELTVAQHLRFFAALKGVPVNRVEDEVKKYIAEVGLVEKTHYRSTMLSGGQKRKLSVAIALIGGSRVVILDEPTSGMDPYSRRSTWQILQRNKAGRVILLTTHFMDEADILGDRIAIMAEGHLRCWGSSLFLKRHYGVGYTLTVVKEDSRFRGEQIHRLVEQYIPDAEVLTVVGAEQNYTLPFSASAAFVPLFRKFETDRQALGISSYGISVTTLEEVFIRVGKGEHDRPGQRRHVPHGQSMQVEGESKDGRGDDDAQEASGLLHVKEKASFDQTGDGFYLNDEGRGAESEIFWTHFRALLQKRFIYAKRDRKAILFQLVIPSVLTLFGLVLLTFRPPLGGGSRVLYASMFNKEKDAGHRNFVPFQPGQTAFGEEIMQQFDLSSDHPVGVYGQAVEVTAAGDQFDGCAQGPEPLVDMSNFVLETLGAPEEHGSSRYMSIIISDEANRSSSLAYHAMANATGLHAHPVALNLVDEAALKVLTGNQDAKITVTTEPLPQTNNEQHISAMEDAFTAATMIVIAFCFLPASYAIFVVKEREVKAKHQQIISGVSIYAYWLSTFTWDAVSYLLPAGLSIAQVYAFQIDNYTKNTGAAATAVIFLLYGPASAAFTYMLSYAFKSHSSAQNVVLFFNFITGLCLMITSFVLNLLESTQAINYYLKYVFRIFPIFCLGDGLAQLAVCDEGKDCYVVTKEGYELGKMAGPFHLDVVGTNVVYLMVEIVVYLAITLGIEYSLQFPMILRFWQRTRDPQDPRGLYEDEDVAAEANRVLDGGADGDVVCLRQLRKVFPTPVGPKVAVRKLSFGIPRGECFGFLGINGAGKSTTLSILSGEFPPTSGTAYIAGFDIQHNQGKIRRRIGYCPQFDALLELLTVREHLELYARIKGVPEGDLMERVVQGKLKQMDLNAFADKAAGSLSGGNKRKLSVAIAMIGGPSIVFLDEPSTGMDPVARRFMWDVISNLSTRGGKCSVILTTHSMEEAEALCTRIGIMVNGGFKCLGGAQRLKERFGGGYDVDIKFSLFERSEVEAGCRLLREAGLLTYPVSDEDFGRVVDIRASLLHLAESQDLETGKASGENVDLAMDQIDPVGRGAEISVLLQSEGAIDAAALVQFWMAEQRLAMMFAFLSNGFPMWKLVETKTIFSHRFRIQTGNGLADTFDRFEDAKVRLCIEEYSIGQVSLEAIFNAFAASSDNPENASAAG